MEAVQVKGKITTEPFSLGLTNLMGRKKRQNEVDDKYYPQVGKKLWEASVARVGWTLRWSSSPGRDEECRGCQR